MAEKGLGRGFSAIFGAEADDLESVKIQNLPISKVEPRAEQPRSVFDEVALDELADSIRMHGMIQPITVRKLDSGYFQIIAGERRWRAARLAGLVEVPVRVIEADDRSVMELALVENLQREDLNPIEEARGYQQLMDEFKITQENAAQRVGKSRSAVTNSLRLLSLCAGVVEMIEDGRLSSGHARTLVPLSDAGQLDAAKKIVDNRLSVRQAEALATRIAKEELMSLTENGEKTKQIYVDYVKEIERELSEVLGRGVKLYTARKKGKIELEFYSPEDREELIADLKEFGKEYEQERTRQER